MFMVIRFKVCILDPVMEGSKLLYPHNPIGSIKALTVFTICYMHIYPTNLRLQDEVYKEKHRQ